MNASLRLAAGRADPFGLLVLAVMLALLVTIGIQAQVAAADDPGLQGASAACLGCLPADG